MNITLIAITDGGWRLAEKLAEGLGSARLARRGVPVGETLAEAWMACDALVCIMSAGIVVRSIAPLCRDKYADPCVVVLDESGNFAVSLLSGHLGGGNTLARQLAAITGGQAVITTASDSLGLTALDLWARDNDLVLRSERKTMTAAAARLVNSGCLRVYADCHILGLPIDFCRVENVDDADLIISSRIVSCQAVVHFSPRSLIVGIGCNRATPSADIARAVDETFELNGLERRSLAGCATIDAKLDEQGLLQFAEESQLWLHYFSREQLNAVEGIIESKYAMAALGVKAVAEPAAILAAAHEGEQGRLLIRKMKWKDVTTAVAEKAVCLKD